MKFIPSLQANYTPVPNSFLQLALSGELGKEAVVVLLYFFSKTYGWKQEKGFVSLEDLVHETDLDMLEATQGIREAMAQEMVLEMPLDPGNPDSASMYLLNTIENRQFMEAYATASQEIPVPPEIRDLAPPQAPTPPSPPPAPPGPPPTPAPLPQPELEIGSMEAPPDLEVIDEVAEAPREVPSLDEIPLPSPGALPPLTQDEVLVPAPGEAAPPPQAQPPASAPAQAPTPNAPYEDWGFTFRTVEMIIRLLGRIPSRDEKYRLQNLGATDGELVEAMGRLIEKKVDIYSSDLIVYEFEAIQSARRRQQRDQARRVEQEDRQSRQKKCRACDGLGYVFVGVSGIQECESCKG